MAVKRRMFGTDGIRDIANEGFLRCESVLKLGKAFVCFLLNRGIDNPKIVVGKDTRISGFMIESALTAGITSVGGRVISVGVVSTPAVAYLVKEYDADGGVVISASHNPAEYNGIKFINKDGYKLSDKEELEIENYFFDSSLENINLSGVCVGDVSFKSGIDDYIKFAMKFASDIGSLNGFKIVVDSSNGAASFFAPKLWGMTGADIVDVASMPDGRNINEGVGVTNIDFLVGEVKKYGADFGVSYDGDVDRVLFVDSKGRLLDGDIMLYVIGKYYKQMGCLGNGVVATVMSNIGLEVKLNAEGIKLYRCSVGDRYVLEKALEVGANVGGEQSGHIIVLDKVTTGDGIITGFLFIKACMELGYDINEVYDLLPRYPQKLYNIRVPAGIKDSILELKEVSAAIHKVQQRLEGRGRIVVRPSGTEPLIRILAEAETEQLVDEAIAVVSDAVLDVVKKGGV